LYFNIEIMSKAERTKRYIVERTAALFNKKGYAGTSLNDLTGATGLTRGSIYGNFMNKDEVAAAAFDYNLSLLQDGMHEQLKSANTATERLSAMINFYRSNIKEVMKRGGCPILNTATDADDTHPLLKKKVVKSIRSWKKNIETILEQGQAAGEITKDLDTTLFAIAFIALIEGGIMLASVSGDANMLYACADRAAAMVHTELKP
jgi:TetR/AcrR family transcriptional repressor of nem operon